VASQPAYMLGAPDAATVSVSGPRPTISIATQSDAIRQRTGTTEVDATGAFQITLSQPSTTAVTVNYTVDSASTVADGDYLQLSGSVTLPANQTTANIVVTLVPQDHYVGTRTLKLA